MTSAPTVYADLVIVGSSIGDNQRVDEPRGTVRAFDVRTGALRWDWDPIPRRADDPAAVTWGEGWRQAGAANVWAPMSVDAARGSANRDSVAVDKHFGQFIGESARRRMTSIHPSATFLPQAQAFPAKRSGHQFSA